MVNEASEVPEFSRSVLVDQVGGAELVREIEATPGERTALAERLDLIALDSLTATLRLRRLPDGLIRVSGRFDAEVVQACVVTLAPVANHCGDAFTMHFGGAREPESVREIEVASVGEDEPEPITDGRIDLGEAVVQQLAVSLDPYPRAPGAKLPETAAGDAAEAEAARENPFAALAQLRRRQRDDR
jgi:uncharacterized metal-binding protein YceD (DUF177 family)